MNTEELGELLQRHKALSDCQQDLVDRLGRTGRDLRVLGTALRDLPHEVKSSDLNFIVPASGAEQSVPRSVLNVDLLAEQLSDLEKKATALREIEAKLSAAGYDRYIPEAGINSNQQVTSE